MRRIISGFVLTFWLAPAGFVGAKTNPRLCASGPERREELRLIAQQNRAARARRPAPRAPERTAARASGGLVLMDAAGGIVSERNSFNLDDRRIAISPAGAGYRFETGAAQLLETAPDDRVLSELGDDDTAGSALPFSFPFYGQRYDFIWINSDGNLTFHRPDTASSDRSLGRFASGPPRISPLFMDLDPSRAGSVIVTVSEQRFTVTWQRVPEYRATGTGPLNTVQVTLHRDGRVDFVYQGITTQEAVVGLSRGQLASTAAIVSFSAGHPAILNGSFAERFTLGNDIDMVTLSQRFYENFADAYDYLVVYNTIGIPAAAGAVAYEVTVRNDRTGYGDREVSDGASYGSRQRLQAVINMGPLSQYPADPMAVVPARTSVRDTPLSILGHEAGHLFLAFASVRDPDFAAARPMLGIQNAHWAFAFNSEASLLEGNRIRDNGPEASPRFETTATAEGYSPLDQYLMGFRAPAEVPPTFLVENPSIGALARPPQTGVRFDGQRRDITVGEIIAAEGRRAPDHTVAQRRFRFAFILLSASGTEPSPEQTAQVDRYRQEFEPYFARVTDQRATAETALLESLSFSAQPAVGVLRGETVSAFTVSVGRAAGAARMIRLRAEPAGIVEAPAAVTIEAGSRTAPVSLRGLVPGVATLSADLDGHETAITRVQVRDNAATLRAWIREGNRQVVRAGRPAEPLIVRAADWNRVPYPGLRILAEAAGGSLTEARLTTGPDGEAAFAFHPDAGNVHEIRFRVEGSTEPAERSVLFGRPVLADGGVVNAASYSPGLSPGALASLFGANLTPAEAPAREPFPGLAGVAGTDVFIGGRAARLLYVSDAQINFVIPESLSPGVYDVEIRNALGASAAKPVSVEEAWPGIFNAYAGRAGEVTAVATGLGVTRLPVTAQVNGTAADVLDVTALPGGEFRVTVRLPPGTTGPVALQITVGGRSSNTVPVR